MEWNSSASKPIILSFLTLMLLKHIFEKYTNIASAAAVQFLLRQLISDNIVKAEDKLVLSGVFCPA